MNYYNVGKIVGVLMLSVLVWKGMELGADAVDQLGGKAAKKGGSMHRNKSKPIFVVQEHDASHLHYDVRLEIDGVLVSWAVPKGPPLRTGIKRLAVQTEDHAMEWATFHGVIKEGYGAGTVRIWDKGTYCNLKAGGLDAVSMKKALAQGRIEVYFHGHKLKGPYALILTQYGKEDKKNWLFMKLKEGQEHACQE